MVDAAPELVPPQSPPVRKATVEMLVMCCTKAMEQSPEPFSGTELMSACLTLSARVLSVILEAAPQEVDRLRAGVEQLWAILPPRPSSEVH